MLSFIEGDSGRDAGSRVSSPDALANFAALLRRFHDAVRDYKPPDDADWALPTTADAPATGVCHGDFAPWNMVWSREEPIGILDFDLAHPAPFDHDVAYALAYSVPFRDDATTQRMLRVDEVPDRRQRIEVFAAAYGVSDDGLVEQVVARQQKYADDVEVLAQRGFVAQWTTPESIERNHEIARWVAENQRLFRK
jgi:aminoglycoside phosphotransferase (APT) family kinase protein